MDLEETAQQLLRTRRRIRTDAHLRLDVPFGRVARRTRSAVHRSHLPERRHRPLGSARRSQGRAPRNCRAVNQPTAGLLKDLKSRGLLDETLVIWGGEFGRTPIAQGTDGRDHDPFGFTMWLAGGGVRGGTTYGKTDEWGYFAVENKVEIHDLHATMLHLLGVWITQEACIPFRRPRFPPNRRFRRGLARDSRLTVRRRSEAVSWLRRTISESILRFPHRRIPIALVGAIFFKVFSVPSGCSRFDYRNARLSAPADEKPASKPAAGRKTKPSPPSRKRSPRPNLPRRSR